MLNILDLITCRHCNNYKDLECYGGGKAQDNFKKLGVEAAKKCEYFSNSKSAITGAVNVEKALMFMLAGDSEFTLTSGKTGKTFRYRLQQKEASNENKQQIYWVYTERSCGEMAYAGILFLDNTGNQSSKTFKFGRGSRGTLNSSDLTIVSLLYVINHLYNKKYDINVEIRHLGRCGRCGKQLLDPSDRLIGLDKQCIMQLSNR